MEALAELRNSKLGIRPVLTHIVCSLNQIVSQRLETSQNLSHLVHGMLVAMI